MTQPPWMQRALAELGTTEIPGAQHNPKIIGWSHAIGHKWVADDETPNCAAFVGAMLEATGFGSTRSLAARSYQKWGRSVREGEPRVGAICVFSRTANPAFGHVAIFISETATHVDVLGSNQDDTVSVASYPKSRLVAMRFPDAWRAPVPGAVLAPLVAPPESVVPPVSAAPPSQRFSESWTVTNLLAGMLAVADILSGWVSGVLGWLADGAAEFAKFGKVTSMLGELGVAPSAVAGSIAIACMTLALHRTVFRNVRREGDA